MNKHRWPDDISLIVNAGPEDGWPVFDIWHTGGPGGPWLTAATEEAALSICAAIEELHELRAERLELRQAILNDRGEGDPPEGGWVVCRNPMLPGHARCWWWERQFVHVAREEDGGWVRSEYSKGNGVTVRRGYLCARDAMRDVLRTVP